MFTKVLSLEMEATEKNTEVTIISLPALTAFIGHGPVVETLPPPPGGFSETSIFR